MAQGAERLRADGGVGREGVDWIFMGDNHGGSMNIQKWGSFFGGYFMNMNEPPFLDIHEPPFWEICVSGKAHDLHGKSMVSG